MSFSKAPYKRFNENAGCAPPVGSYDPKLKEKTVALHFDKGGDRFKAPKDIVPGPGAFSLDVSVKKCMLNSSVCSNGGDKKKLQKLSTESCVDLAKIRELEKEIKRLVQDRTVDIPETSRKLIEKLQKRLNHAAQELDVKLQQYRCIADNRISKMEENKQMLEQDLQNMQSELKHAADKSDSLEKSRCTLSRQYSALQKMIQELRSESFNHQDYIRFLKGEIFCKEDNIKEEGQILFEVKAEKASLMEKLESLEEENGTLNENIQMLTEKYHIIEGRLAEEQNQNNVTSDQVQSQLEVTKSHLIKVQDEYQVLQAKNKQLVHSVNREKESVENLIYQLDEQRQMSCDLQNLVTDKEDRIVDLEISLEATKVELQNVMETIECKEADILKLKENIQNLEMIERSLKVELDKEKDVGMRTARQHADRILELEQLEISVTEKNIKLCKQLDESNQRLSVTEAKLDNVTEESKVKVESLTNQLDNVTEESKVKVESLTNQLDQVAAESNVKVESLINQLDQVTTESNVKVESLANQLDLVTAESNVKVESLTNKLEQVIKEREIMNEELETIQRDCNDWKINFGGLQEELKVKENELEIEKEGKDKVIQEMTGNIQSLVQEKQNMIDSIDCLKEELDSVKCQNNQLIQQLEKLEKMTEDKVSKLKVDKQLTEDKLSKLDVKFHSLNKENNQLMNEIEFLQDSKLRLIEEAKDEKEDQITEKVSQIISLQEMVNQSEYDRELLNIKISQIEKENQQLENELKTTGSLQEIMGSLRVEKQRLEKELETKESLQEIVNQSEYDKELLNKKISQMEGLMESLSVENAQLEKELERVENQRLEKELEAKESLQEIVNQNENDKELLNKQISQIELENQRLGKELERVENQQFEKELKTKESIQEIVNQNENDKELLNKKISQMEVENQRLETELERVEKALETKESLQEIVNQTECDKELLNKKISQMEVENQRLEKELETKESLQEIVIQSECDKELLNKKISQMEGSMESLKVENKRLEKELETKESLQSTIQSLEEEKEDISRQYEDELTDLRDKARTMSETNWKKLYEELMTKVEPFMSQLDAYETEKMALLGRSQFAQAEMDKLSQAYAKLLGHQNQKQKIHHIVKIKEENNNLKKEVTALREQFNKQKRTNQKLEEKISSLEGKKKYEPCKAFQHKENRCPQSPLKDGNKK